jgi:hypothetical protein
LPASIAVAGLAIAAAIVARPASEAPRFQIVAASGGTYRLDTKTGALAACDGQLCMQISTSGEDVGKIQKP